MQLWQVWHRLRGCVCCASHASAVLACWLCLRAQVSEEPCPSGQHVPCAFFDAKLKDFEKAALLYLQAKLPCLLAGPGMAPWFERQNPCFAV